MILDDFATRLGTTISGEITTALMPDDADEITVVSEYASVAPAPHDSHHPRSIQVRSRSLSYDTARANCVLAYTSLHKLAETTVGNTYVVYSFANQEPFPLGYDGKRWDFAVNFRILTT